MQIIFLCAYCYARPTNLKTTTQFYFYFFRMIFPLLHQHIYGLFFKAKNRFIYLFFIFWISREFWQKNMCWTWQSIISWDYSHVLKIITLRALWKNHQKNIYYVGKTCYLLENKYTTYLIHFLENIYIRNM